MSNLTFTRRLVGGFALISVIVCIGPIGMVPARGQTPTTVRTPEPADLRFSLRGINFYRLPPLNLPDEFGKEIAHYLGVLRFYQRNNSCDLFQAYFQGETFAYIEAYLTEFAVHIRTFSAAGGDRALADVRRFVMEAGKIEREGCPPQTRQAVNRQDAPRGAADSCRVLTGDELRRVMPNVAIARGHVFADANVGRRVRNARQKMQDGIGRCDRTLYDEGLAELNALHAELTQTFNTLIGTPLDPGVDTPEAKTQRVAALLRDGRAIDALRRGLVFSTGASKTVVAKPRGKRRSKQKKAVRQKRSRTIRKRPSRTIERRPRRTKKSRSRIVDDVPLLDPEKAAGD